MPVRRPAQRPPKPPRGNDERLVKGVYLTDGRALYRVLEVVELSVELENCALPSGLPQWMGVGEVLQKLRLVRPARGVEGQG